MPPFPPEPADGAGQPSRRDADALRCRRQVLHELVAPAPISPAREQAIREVENAIQRETEGAEAQAPHATLARPPATRSEAGPSRLQGGWHQAPIPPSATYLISR